MGSFRLRTRTSTFVFVAQVPFELSGSARARPSPPASPSLPTSLAGSPARTLTPTPFTSSYRHFFTSSFSSLYLRVLLFCCSSPSSFPLWQPARLFADEMIIRAHRLIILCEGHITISGTSNISSKLDRAEKRGAE